MRVARVDVARGDLGGVRRVDGQLDPDGAELLFQHCGHRDNIVDFQWNQSDPWTLLSVSDDTSAGGGGALQMWRINDLIYRPQAEVLAELEQYKDFILTGKD